MLFPDDAHEDDAHEPDAFVDLPLRDEEVREIERRMNINRLKGEANEITGGEIRISENADAPSEVLEACWNHVVAFERAPQQMPLRQLNEAGIAVPPAGELDDDALHALLWQIIEWLATRRFYLSDTDHQRHRPSQRKAAL